MSAGPAVGCCPDCGRTRSGIAAARRAARRACAREHGEPGQPPAVPPALVIPRAPRIRNAVR